MKRLAAMILAAAAVFCLAACGESKEAGELTLATGNSGGTYYSFGRLLAAKVSERSPTKVTVIESGGSKVNIESLQSGDAQLAFTQSDVASYGYHGTRLFEKKVDCYSIVAQLYMEQVQIVTLDPDIKSVTDLAGRNVSIGAAGSGVYFNAVDILHAYGIDADTGINPAYQSFTDSLDALRAGKLVAAFIVAGAPTEAVTKLAETEQIYFVSLDDAHIEQLTAESPYYSKSVIPKEVYGTDGDVTTVAVAALIAARSDVADSDVYNFVSTVFDNAEEIAAANGKGAELDLSFAASYTPVPYHPGAVKYFSEKGVSVPR